MEKLLAIQLHNRKIFHHYLKHFDLEQLNYIPDGFNNNILWNIAHTVVTQQLLVYKISGLDMHIPKEWIGLFAKGTKPERRFTTEEVAAIDTALFTTYEALEKDMTAFGRHNNEFYTFPRRNTPRVGLSHGKTGLIFSNCLHDALGVNTGVFDKPLVGFQPSTNYTGKIYPLLV